MRVQPLLLLLFIPTLFGFSDIQASFSWENGGGKIQYIDVHETTVRGVIFIEDAVTEVMLRELKAGQSYYIQASHLGTCQPVVELPGYSKGKQSMFNFIAGSETQAVLVHTDFLNKGCSGAMYLTVMCSSCTTKPADPAGSPDAPPIFAVPGVPAQTLVNNVFIGGGCFDTDNISFSGSSISAGTFGSGSTSIGLESGVILSSGNVALAAGPNNSTSAGMSSGGGSDPDLAQAAGASIFDAAVLEFDFTPTQSQITFRYVFASEEYCDFVNSGFNDAFGFFLSGPGISGPYSNNGTNIATLPNSGTPVTINNVNHITNSAFYVGNIPAGSGQLTNPNCAGHPVSGPPATDDCQYDGFTVILTAVANVIPCETYHIKLAVGDAGDSAYDSAVFLEANSFDAGGDAEVAANVPFTGSTEAFEGCTDAFFFFQRSGGDVTQPLVINYTISGTATPGVDYAPIPGSVTIPAGQSFFMLPVTVFDDLINEGTETIVIDLFNPCSCTTSTATLEITDPPPVEVEITGGIVCEGLPIVIQPTVSGGVQPTFYQWSPASSSPVYVGFPTQSGVYSVTVTDYCGSMDTDTAYVEVYTLSATISGAVEICPGGDPGFLDVSFTGQGPWNLTYIVNGATPGTINNITANPYQLPVTQEGVYEIVAVTNGQCIGEGFGEGVVTVPDIELLADVTDVLCFGDATGAIDLSAAGGTSPYTFNWNNSADTEDLGDLTAGSYTVTVVDAEGCLDSLTANITEPALLQAEALVLSGVDCTNPTGGSIDLDVAGGIPDYSYLWNTGDTTQDLSGLTAGVYTVTVTDLNGCIQTGTAAIQGDTLIPTATIQVSGVVNCTNTTITLDGSNSSSGPHFVYQWSVNGGGVITGGLNDPVTTAEGGGTYELLVTDTTNLCFTQASVVVPEDFNAPVADAGPDQILNCLVSEVTLDGSGSSTGAGIQYTWTTGNGNFTSPTDIASPTADAPGVYTLVVLNLGNGCADTSVVAVTADLLAPLADAGADNNIDCVTPSLELDGSGSSSGPEFTYLWTTPDGNIAGDSSLVNPTVDQAGMYIILVTNTINGCTDTDEVLITDLSIDPVIQIETPGILTCAISEISIDATGSDNGPDFIYDWLGLDSAVIVSGGDTPTPVAGSVGTFQLTLTNSVTGCVSVDSVTVLNDVAPPVADAGQALTIACDLPDMQLDGTGSSSGPGISYGWVASNGGNIVSGATTNMPTVNSPGIYTLTVLDAGNGCSAQDTVSVVLDSNAPNAAAAAPQILNCAHPEVVINGLGSSLGADFSYNWVTGDGHILNGNGTLFLTVNQPGTYSLTVTNQTNACTSEAEVILGIDTLAPQAVVADPDLLTCAVTSIQLDGSGSSAGPEFSYNWSTPDGNIAGDPSSIDPAVNQPGLYTLLVTSAVNGCTETAEVEVLQDIVPPDAEAGLAGVLNCGVTSLNLDGTGSSTGPVFSYAWTTASGNFISGENTLTPLIGAPGIYEIEVLNSDNGCAATDQVEIILDVAPPQAQIASPGILTCALTSLELDGSFSSGISPLTYAWATPNGNIQGPASIAMPTVDQPGDYQLIVTHTGNLCSDTAMVTVDQNIAPPTAEAGPTFELDCGTTSLSLNGAGSSSGPDFTYLWTTANGILLGDETTLNPMVGAAGIYTLTVLDNVNGCSSTDEVVVTLDDDAPVSSAGAAQLLTCAVTSVILDGSGSSQGQDYTYVWTTDNGNIVSGAGTLAPEVNAPGTYLLTVTNLINDCQTISSVLVTQNITPPDAEAGATAIITCDETLVSLNAAASSQGPAFTYQWTTPDGNIVSGGAGLTPQVDQPGVYNLLVTNNANGCTATDATTVAIDQVPPTVVLQTPGTLTCDVMQLMLSGAGTSTGPNFAYQWTTVDGHIASGAQSLSPTINEPGAYLLTVVNEDNGCEASASVTVSEDVTPPDVEAGNTDVLTCAITTLQLNGAGSSAGPTFTYQWTTSGGAIQSGATTLTPTIGAPGTYTLTVENTANGCTASDVVSITQDVALPEIVIASPPSLTCLIDEVSLNAGGSDFGAGYLLDWTTAGGNIVNTTNLLQPLVDAPGAYTLTILNLANGCSDSETVTVIETLDPPGASAGSDVELHCNLPVAQLQGSSPIGASGQYVWTTPNGAILSGSNTAQPSVGAAGVYTLTVTNPLNGCTSTDEVTVTESFPVDFAFEVDPPVCKGFPGTIQFGQVLGGTPPYQYSISGGFTFSGQTFYPGLDAGAYDLVVQDANGCPLFAEAFLAPGIDVEVLVDREVFLSLGEDYEVQLFVNVGEDDIDTIIWEPAQFLSCTDCLDPVVTPTSSVDYLVTIKTKEGCEGETRISFRVKKQANVYIPNIFSPNGDGENDLFMIFTGNQVAKIRSFLVFNRWGEPVYKQFDFQPNNPAHGWDGMHRGQPADPAVFTYFAEIELLDGRVELFEGSVILIR